MHVGFLNNTIVEKKKSKTIYFKLNSRPYKK